MERGVENQLLGITAKQVQDSILPTKIKPKRQSLKKAQKQVQGSVKGKVKNISKEQGFRNYVKYTDPLLLNNNEIDQSDIANSIANILNVFHPNKMKTEKLQQVQNFMVKEKPVDVNDVKTEVKPDENLLKNKAATKIQALTKGAVFRTNKLPNIVEENIKYKFDKAATKIQAVYRGNDTRKEVKRWQEKISNMPSIQKQTGYLETPENKGDAMTYVHSPEKTRKYNTRLQEKKREEKATKLQAVIRGHKARKETKQFIKIQAKRMEENPSIQGSQVIRLHNGQFDKRALGNNRRKKGTKDDFSISYLKKNN